MGRLQSFDFTILQHALGLVAIVMGLTESSNAQVLSSHDAIGTRVVQQDHQFTITGGTATDGSQLLFHSFEQFDLASAATAEFLVSANVETIFSRITNGLPSHINGLITVSGAPASLYLLNPAGVLFGSGAMLNLGGDFAALTAERIDFTQGFFDLTQYPGDVRGSVLQLHFDPFTPGAIINSGRLDVSSNRTLSLVGHTVINQGTLSGGEIILAAVGQSPGISLENGLKYNIPGETQSVSPGILSDQSEHATAIEVDRDGLLRLTGAQSDLPPGTVFVAGDLTTVGKGKIQVLGDFVAVAGANIQASNGGTILVGGGYQGLGPTTAQTTIVDAASTLRADGLSNETSSGGQVVVWADGYTRFLGLVSAQGHRAAGNVEISGKQYLEFGGQVDLRSQDIPGTLLLDPQTIEIRAGVDPGGENNPEILYEGTLETAIVGNPNLVIQADGDITINPLSDGVLNFPGSISFLADADADGQGRFSMEPSDQLRTMGQDIEITAADITAGDLNTSIFSTIDNNLDGGEIRLSATQGSIIAGNLNSPARGTLSNSGTGGRVTLSAFQNIDVQTIQTTTNEILNNSGSAGEIELTANTGTISTGNLSTAIASGSNSGTGGNITLRAAGNVLAENIITAVSVDANNSANAGNVSLTSLFANILIGSIATDTAAGRNNSGSGGSIVLNAAQGTISAQQLTSTAQSPNFTETVGGDINLRADKNIVVDFINASAQGKGGEIDIVTQGLFQAFGRIANSDTSLLTTGDSGIRIAYRSDLDTPFAVGTNSLHGTSGNLVTGLDRLLGPQTITQSVNLNTIQLVNTFQVLTPDTPPIDPDNPVIVPSVPPTEESVVNPSGLVGENTILEVERHETSSGEQDRLIETSREEEIWVQIDSTFSAEFAEALNIPMPAVPTLRTLQDTLQTVGRTQNITPGIVYVRLNDSQLELLLVSGEGPPVYRPVDITAAEVRAVIDDLHRTVTNPLLRSAQYLPPAQQLYDWLVRPMVDDLEMAKIDHLGFVLDAGLRSLPMAALHDGDQFLIENYSIGLLPSAGLTDLVPSEQVLSHADLMAESPSSTLAMGIADFVHQADLEAVPLELALAVQSTGDNYYLDHEATLAALHHHLEQKRFTSMHLATHAVFEAGNLENSYVQLWDRAISLDELQTLPLEAIEFLILSACATALGDAEAEFGFAGLAVKVGVQTALASLWSISDEGTLGLMSEFYQAIETQPTRSAALRQAQLAMLQGDVGVDHGNVYGRNHQTIGYLPGLEASGRWDFSHPAYWSGFTMIGNPW